jgi:hypothetical protein
MITIRLRNNSRPTIKAYFEYDYKKPGRSPRPAYAYIII